ncbi:hypothetical protein BWQ96_02888 [Gracilariopsis chorda]|uniref:Uncharacterized protein n=1 Tax=Gracilariopsis chorda TaxID=448386 RepID=A0A2V3IYY1_9FLOR|nr:hypothetical protein BWQ96_02888 [Gracilariopsis chorda]|eukprot:PXF47275.1 hypothetical protein BWQ96_02888 [Gracilariopsis chorda]
MESVSTSAGKTASDVDLVLHKTTENEVRKHVKWSDNHVIFNQVHTLVRFIGPAEVEDFMELLKELQRRLNRVKMVTKNMLDEFHTVMEQYPREKNRVTIRDVDGQTAMTSLLPPNRANSKLTKRKKSFTERLHAKKHKLIEKHDNENGFGKRIRKLPTSPQESSTRFHRTLTREQVAKSISKAVNIIESFHRQ